MRKGGEEEERGARERTRRSHPLSRDAPRSRARALARPRSLAAAHQSGTRRPSTACGRSCSRPARGSAAEDLVDEFEGRRGRGRRCCRRAGEGRRAIRRRRKRCQRRERRPRRRRARRRSAVRRRQPPSLPPSRPSRRISCGRGGVPTWRRRTTTPCWSAEAELYRAALRTGGVYSLGRCERRTRPPPFRAGFTETDETPLKRCRLAARRRPPHGDASDLGPVLLLGRCKNRRFRVPAPLHAQRSPREDQCLRCCRTPPPAAWPTSAHAASKFRRASTSAPASTCTSSATRI